MEQTLEKLDFLLERTPHGVLETLLRNLNNNDIIESGVQALDDYLKDNFDDDLLFLKAFLNLEYGNLNNMIDYFKNEYEEE